MNDIPLNFFIVLLVILLLLSAFFAGSETALMSINRYRLRHLAKNGHRGAQFAERLLKRPDRLIGTILLGNIAVHSASSAITTFITLRLWGETWIAASTGVLTLFILIFGEIAPKTLSALYPKRVAIPSSYIYVILQWVLFPLVWLTNLMSNALLRIIGISSDERVEGIDAPTFKEGGVDVSIQNWLMVAAAPGITAEQEAAINADVEKLVKSESWQKALKDKGWADTYLAGPAFKEQLAKDVAATETILKEIGLVK